MICRNIQNDYGSSRFISSFLLYRYGNKRQSCFSFSKKNLFAFLDHHSFWRKIPDLFSNPSASSLFLTNLFIAYFWTLLLCECSIAGFPSDLPKSFFLLNPEISELYCLYSEGLQIFVFLPPSPSPKKLLFELWKFKWGRIVNDWNFCQIRKNDVQEMKKVAALKKQKKIAALRNDQAQKLHIF